MLEGLLLKLWLTLMARMFTRLARERARSQILQIFDHDVLELSPTWCGLTCDCPEESSRRKPCDLVSPTRPKVGQVKEGAGLDRLCT